MERALGISAAKQLFARQTGIQTTQSGMKREDIRDVIILS